MKESKSHTKLMGVRLPNRPGVYDVSILGGQISSISNSDISDSCRLALPAFFEPHVHANRAYSEAENHAHSLAGAIQASLLDRKHATVGDFRSRADRLFRQALSFGSLSIRTHTDLDEVSGFRALEGVAEARQALSGQLDVDMIAFLTTKLDPASEKARSELIEAKDLGVKYVGAVPAFYENPERSIDAIMDFAACFDMSVDLHIDEHLNAKEILSGYAAECAMRCNLHRRVTLSHCSALSQLDDVSLRRTIDVFLQAELDVVSLPATNLYLQDRGPSFPRLRGVTAIQSLLTAGVPVLFGSDNVQDHFFRFGNADPLEAAFLAALSGHVEEEKLLLKGICGGKCDINEGDRADIVLLQSANFFEALSDRPKERTVLRAGKPVHN